MERWALLRTCHMFFPDMILTGVTREGSSFGARSPCGVRGDLQSTFFGVGGSGRKPPRIRRPQGPASGEGEKLCLKQNLKEETYLRVLRKRLGGGGLRCPRCPKGLPGAPPGASRSRSDADRFRDPWNPENQCFLKENIGF